MHSGSMPREALAACRVPPRRLILGVVALFGTGQLCSCVAMVFGMPLGRMAGLAWCVVGLLPQLRANVPTRS